MPPYEKRENTTTGVFRNILERKTYSFICAIDFGTSGTGFCYAVLKNGKIDAKRDIITNPDWPGNQGRGKTSTSIILNKTTNAYIKFGTEAKYAARDYAFNQRDRFFELFKMQLYEHMTDTPFIVKDTANNGIDALIVFRESLRFIKKVFFEHLRMKNVSCSEMDVSWVLTIPAIWDDAAKSLMRKAAVAAELEKEDGQLMFALEPEAASLWCLASGGISLKEKDVYMVVDCGGGTVDITIHEVERADAQRPLVKEVTPASGGAWGSTSIDRCVFKLFEEIFGRNRYDQMMKDPLGHTQLQDNVERAKCSFNGEINPVIQLPDSLLNSTKNDSNTPNQAVSIYNRVNQTRLQLKGSNLLIPAAIFSDFISSAIRSILNHVHGLLLQHRIKYVVMVGNFANCVPLQKQMETLMDTFKIKLIIPDQPGDAIMKGAVIYGLDPSSVTSRRARKTYGVKILGNFIDGVHPIERLVIKEGERFCSDVFDVFVHKNEIIPSGYIVERKYTKVERDQTQMGVDILISDEDVFPLFADHYSVEVIGKHTINTPMNGTGSVTTGMLFGDTEIRCKSVNELGQEVETALVLT
ncbi:hypothetical protein BC936DRAFT_141054 [Jimgerdemannia flammicorona]|uniref:Heat shock protein 70 family n=1 Tax=Jimgerdemannia flammicorona TaxID=994334 RepID=A0A433DGD6_9FUNG|nr:hypothetical protein BC936DRAFT_141054 [Jimgerdemannia flammicorona]